MPRVLRIAPVADDQWDVVAWLWQAFRNDLARVVRNSYPYPDGRYKTVQLAEYPGPGRAGWLAWAPHPQAGDDAPVGFALVDGLEGDRRTIAGFWIAPPLRRSGLGAAVALAVLGAHPGPWEIGFQHGNAAAGAFWRRVADAAFGPGGWTETMEPVPGRPHVPPDHFIRSR